jgi:energy-coupling factor transporter ATP-binding protein EcfA2
LRHPGWVELPDESAPERVLGLLESLANRSADQRSLIQILLQPTWMTTDDGRQPAFWLAGRVAASGGSSRLALLKASLGQFSGLNGVRFGRTETVRSGIERALNRRTWPRRFLPPGLPATPLQVASLFHPPADTSNAHALSVTRSVRTPAHPSATGRVIGEGRDAFGSPVPIRIQTAGLLRHGLVIGPSGAGKSTLLASLALDLITSGTGVTVIDPHCSLVSEIASAVPVSRLPMVSLLRFGDTEHPVSLNPLRAGPGQATAVADELIEIIQRLGRGFWGPVLDITMRHAALAAIESNGSLVGSARILEDPAYREQLLPSLTNPETVRFLEQLGTADGFDRRTLPAVHRLQRLLASPWLRNILGQSENSLHFDEMFDRGESLLCDLSGVGVANAKLMGSLLLLMLRQATLARDPRSAQQRPHVVFVDEASWFVSSSVTDLYDMARKFGVGIVLALQRIGQLAPEPVQEAVLANAATTVFFRINAHEEATRLARHLASDRVTASDLQHLPRYEAYVQLTADGDRHEPAWMRTLPVGRPLLAEATRSLEVAAANGRQRYTRPRSVVEAEMARRSGDPTLDGDPEIKAIDP